MIRSIEYDRSEFNARLGWLSYTEYHGYDEPFQCGIAGTININGSDPWMLAETFPDNLRHFDTDPNHETFLLLRPYGSSKIKPFKGPWRWFDLAILNRTLREVKNLYSMAIVFEDLRDVENLVKQHHWKTDILTLNWMVSDEKLLLTKERLLCAARDLSPPTQ